MKKGLLGLVVALVEILRDVLRLQALRRMDTGSLADSDLEALGKAFLELDEALEAIKGEHGLEDCVKALRDGLDDLVSGAVIYEE